MSMVNGARIRTAGVAGVALALLALSWRAYGWPGLVAAVSALVLWALLHLTRLLHVLRRAAHRPMGSVDSAVMLQSKLSAGLPLWRVLALTRALGERVSAPHEQPECWRWSDAGAASVSCEFRLGRLVAWQLSRPESQGTPGSQVDSSHDDASRVGAGS